MIEWALDSSCSWQSGVAYDGFGDSVFADAVSFPCRYQAGIRLLRTPTGDVVVSLGKVYLAASDGSRVNVGDRITKDGRAYRVVQMKSGQADGFVDHVVLYLGG